MSDNTNNGFPVPEEPLTREEQYLSAIAGVTASTEIPEKPLTRVEAYLDRIVENGGGGGGGGFTPTDAQLDAMNSGITEEDVEQISTNKNNILNIETQNRNKLPYTLDTLKAINTAGTWNNNVYTINNLSFTVNADMSISVALVSGDTPTATYFYLCPISDLKIDNATYIGYARYNNQNVDYSTTNYFGLYGVSGVANLILNTGVDIPSDYASRYTHAIIRISAALSPQYQLWKPVIEDKTLYTAGITSYIPYTPSNRELYDNLGGSDYIVTASGRRLYISDSAPTGEIPVGSIGVGW